MHVPLKGMNGFVSVLSPGVRSDFEIFQHSLFEMHLRCSYINKWSGHFSTHSRFVNDSLHTVQLVESEESHEPKHDSWQQFPVSSQERVPQESGQTVKTEKIN